MLFRPKRPKRRPKRPKLASTVAQLSRSEHHIEPPAWASTLSLDLRGMSKLRAYARGPLAIVAVVLIVLILVAGKVLIANSGGTLREDPHREDRGRCIERVQRTEVIERTCERDGS